MDLEKIALDIRVHPLQVQGQLIVVSMDKEIIAISADLGGLLDTENATGFLGLSFEEFAKEDFGFQKIGIAIDRVIQDQDPRQLMLQSIKGKVYYISVYREEKYVFVEWELQHRKSISAHEMNEIGFLFEKYPRDIWKSVCRAIQQLVQFDRVFVFRYEAHEGGEIIAEYSKDDRLVFQGTHFSSSYMPKDAAIFYQGASHRYCPDVAAETQVLYAICPALDLTSCAYQSFPEIHTHYLKDIDVAAIVTYPIWVNDSFWGMVIAQHAERKEVDLQKRKLGSFIVQNAVNKYETSLKNKLLEHREQMKEVELEVKEKLAHTNTVNCALVQSLELLCRTPEADGVVVYHKGNVFGHGTCPTEEQVRQIVAFLVQQPKRPLFKDHNFGLKHGQHIENKLPFAGLMALQIGQQDDHFMIWFRQENVRNVQYIELSELVGDKTVGRYHMWGNTVYNTALPWNDDNLSFVQNLDKLISASIISKTREYEKINEELISLNNELEMLTYTLSHDLKNPLSVVKMGIQFLDLNEGLSVEKQRKWRSSMRRGVEHMEEMVKNLVQAGSSYKPIYMGDPIAMSTMIHAICDEIKLLYNCSKSTIRSGQLLPLWGDKSLLYQIFSNVIGNAIKYSSRQDCPLVTIESQQRKKAIVYSISDNGIGIPDQQLITIFDSFSRASNSTDFEGTGLGLSLVKRIMERHGGEVEVSSTLDIGTTVKLIFPAGEFSSPDQPNRQ